MMGRGAPPLRGRGGGFDRGRGRGKIFLIFGTSNLGHLQVKKDGVQGNPHGIKS